MNWIYRTPLSRFPDRVKLVMRYIWSRCTVIKRHPGACLEIWWYTVRVYLSVSVNATHFNLFWHAYAKANVSTWIHTRHTRHTRTIIKLYVLCSAVTLSILRSHYRYNTQFYLVQRLLKYRRGDGLTSCAPTQANRRTKWHKERRQYGSG